MPHTRVRDALSAEPPPNLVAGQWRAPRGKIREEQFDPSDGEQTGWLVHASDADVDEAVAAAVRAQPAHARRTVEDRLDRVRLITEQLAATRPVLIELITEETGKTVPEAERELDLASELLDWLASPPDPLPDASTAQVLRRPLGVAAGISLYHYPVVSVLWMAIPALAAGNGYVLRPCTWSPVTGVQVGRIIEASFPDGEFNVVHGGIEVVNRLLEHPLVSAVSYVGSGRWAHYMYEHGAESGKRIQSLGALRQVHVVLRGADLLSAASEISQAAMEYAGQRWLAGTTVFVEPAIADDLVGALVASLRQVRVGAAYDVESGMGPVVRLERKNRLADHLSRVEESHFALDGRPELERPGYFLGPTVVDHVSADSPLWLQEVPGPLVSVIRVDAGEIESIVAGASNGLVGSVYGPSETSRPLAASLPLSIVSVDRRIGEVSPGTPFAGWSPSFFGSDYWNGPDQQRFFTRAQVMVK